MDDSPSFPFTMNIARLESILGIQGIFLEKHKTEPIMRKQLEKYNALLLLDYRHYSDKEVEDIYDFVVKDSGSLLINYLDMPFYNIKKLNGYYDERTRKIGRLFGISDLTTVKTRTVAFLGTEERSYGTYNAEWEPIIEHHPITRGLKNNLPLDGRWITPLEVNDKEAETLISIRSNLFGIWDDKEYGDIVVNEKNVRKAEDVAIDMRITDKIVPVLAVNKKYRMVAYSSLNYDLYSDFELNRYDRWHKFLLDLFSWACGIEGEPKQGKKFSFMY